MAGEHTLTPPRIYLIRMAVFLILVGFATFILYRPIGEAFLANPGLNGLIVGVLLVGIVLAIRQVVRLFREVRWVNARRRTTEGEAPELPSPDLLAPMAAVIGNRPGRVQVPVATARALLDSTASRLDENRDLVRYLASLLILLGLLGTFWGLIETVGALSRVITGLRTGNEAGAMFDDLKTNLAAPLSGLALAFSPSLFGLAGSLVLGFLDIQAGQAQGRFYKQLEDWLSTAATDASEPSLRLGSGAPDIALALTRLTAAVNDGTSGRAATQAMANLAEGIQGLVQHMRSEQQMIRDWVEAQAAREREFKTLLERIARERV